MGGRQSQRRTRSRQPTPFLCYSRNAQPRGSLGVGCREPLPKFGRVAPGSETPGLWQRDSPVEDLADSLLLDFTKHLLPPSAAWGLGRSAGQQLQQPTVAFARTVWLHPPVSKANDPHDCHGPCFLLVSGPLRQHYRRAAGSAYVQVLLGTDSRGKKVWEYVHRIVLWCRCGAPNPQPSELATGVSRPATGRWCALHEPCCQPGCCSPVHVRWGTDKENALDRELKKHSRRRAIQVGFHMEPHMGHLVIWHAYNCLQPCQWLILVANVCRWLQWRPACLRRARHRQGARTVKVKFCSDRKLHGTNSLEHVMAQLHALQQPLV